MKAIYPGTFDPITNGHLDVIERARSIFDEIVVAIYANPTKKPLFSTEERVDLATKSISAMVGVTVTSFSDQLMVDFAQQIEARVIIRGLRAISDFDSELSYAQANRKLEPGLETVFLMTSLEYAYLSSTTVKEISSLKGDLSDMAPPHVITALKEKFK